MLGVAMTQDTALAPTRQPPTVRVPQTVLRRASPDVERPSAAGGRDAWPSPGEWAAFVEFLEQAKVLLDEGHSGTGPDQRRSVEAVFALVVEADAMINGDPSTTLDERNGLLDRVAKYAVQQARDQGMTWAEIADATHVPRQAAWRRWKARGIH